MIEEGVLRLFNSDAENNDFSGFSMQELDGDREQ